jgi:hypothetical protein
MDDALLPSLRIRTHPQELAFLPPDVGGDGFNISS